MPSTEIVEIFEAMGLAAPADVKGGLKVEDPSSGEIIAQVAQDDREAAMAKLARAHEAFASFRLVPGPVRGELVRKIGERLRQHKESLARLVCVEMGKGIEEARGEVQEMIDICDFATGLSRSLGGRTMLSERPGHRMFE